MTPTPTPSPTERRLTDTLQAVADRTEPISPHHGRYADAGPGPRFGFEFTKSRGTWLAAAAAITIGFGAIAYSTSGTSTTEAAGTGESSGTPAAVEAPEGAPTDGPLHLLPPADFVLPESIEFASGAEVTSEGDGAAILVARPVDDGFEDMVAIFRSSDNGGFAIDPDSSTTVAGRELFDSFDEGVGEQLGDGTWVIYQTEFNDPQLDRLVAATSLVDDTLVFDDAEGRLQVVASIEDADALDATTTVAFPAEDNQVAGGAIQGYVLVTSEAESESEAFYYAASFGTDHLEPVSTNGSTPASIFVGRPGFGSAIVAWTPAPGYVASGLFIGGTDDDIVEFITGMRIVDAATWEQELSGESS